MSDTPETDTQTLIEAMRILSRDIESGDGVANAAIAEAAERIDDLRRELNDTIRSCHIWQDGHSKIVEDRDYWKAEAERWREINK